MQDQTVSGWREWVEGASRALVCARILRPAVAVSQKCEGEGASPQRGPNLQDLLILSLSFAPVLLRFAGAFGYQLPCFV